MIRQNRGFRPTGTPLDLPSGLGVSLGLGYSARSVVSCGAANDVECDAKGGGVENPLRGPGVPFVTFLVDESRGNGESAPERPDLDVRPKAGDLSIQRSSPTSERILIPTV